MLKLNFKKQSQGNFKPVSEGYHVGFIVDYMKPFEAETMKGDKYMATRFMIETDEFTNDGKKRLVCLSKNIRLDSLHPKSNLYALACAALKKKEVVETDLPDLETLLYKHVGFVVSQNEKDGKTYANVESVFACKDDPKDWKSTYEPWESSGTEDNDQQMAEMEKDAKAAAQSQDAKEQSEAEAEIARLLK